MKMTILCEQCQKPYKYNYKGGMPKIFCNKCARARRKLAWRKASRDRRARNGALVDVGSGNNQWGESNHMWDGGKRAYRQIALDAHGNRCFICGSMEDVQVHHRNRTRTSNGRDNLIPICVDCHRAVHVLYEVSK